MAEADALYGPALPPGFKKSTTTTDDDDDGPQIIGPQLPPTMHEDKGSDSDDDDDDDNDDDDDDDDSPVIGPQLPPGFVRTDKGDSEEEEEEDDEDLIGPLPYQGDEDGSASLVKEEFDKRAQRMKNKLCGVTETKPVQREEWMTTLPASLKPAFGTGPRTFRQRNAPENVDTSAWTSIPGKEEEPKDNPKRAEKSEQGNEFLSSARDEQLSEIIKEYNDKSRTESLLEMHQKNRKRKQDEPKERRPFDRSVDLEHVRFDDAQRKALIKRSHQLNDRFSAGKTKFL